MTQYGACCQSHDRCYLAEVLQFRFQATDGQCEGCRVGRHISVSQMSVVKEPTHDLQIFPHQHVAFEALCKMSPINCGITLNSPELVRKCLGLKNKQRCG